MANCAEVSRPDKKNPRDLSRGRLAHSNLSTKANGYACENECIRLHEVKSQESQHHAVPLLLCSYAIDERYPVLVTNMQQGDVAPDGGAPHSAFALPFAAPRESR